MFIARKRALEVKARHVRESAANEETAGHLRPLMCQIATSGSKPFHQKSTCFNKRYDVTAKQFVVGDNENAAGKLTIIFSDLRGGVRENPCPSLDSVLKHRVSGAAKYSVRILGRNSIRAVPSCRSVCTTRR